MTTSHRIQRHPGWLYRQLNQGRFIRSLFLVGLVLLLFLGFAGVLQTELATMGAGQTELAYTVATLRNGASLKPIKKAARFGYGTTPDADLQKYFDLDPETGDLTLRDGLQSISEETNPLSSFPYQIVETPPDQSRKKVINLYIQVLNCHTFLAQHASLNQQKPTDPLPYSEADAVLRCIGIAPVMAQQTTLQEINAWINKRSNALKLLNNQRNEYLKWAKGVLSLPDTSPDTHPRPLQTSEPSPPKVALGKIPVRRLYLLEDRAEPGLRIFSMADPPTRPSAPDTVSDASRSGARESKGGALLRSSDQIFLFLLRMRYPFLLGFGLLAPLLFWIMRQRDPVVRHCLEPYLSLLLAQAMSMFIANALMGEGLVIWVGLVYTLLRIVQLVGLFKLSQAKNARLRELFDLRSRPVLKLCWG